MSTERELIYDLLKGTLRMREQGEKWLPKEPKERPDQYTRRLQRAILFGGLHGAMKRLTDLPFSKEVSLNKELPTSLTEMQWNLDYAGSSLTDFARRLFWDALGYGHTHYYVDYPRSPGPTLADEEGARPYFVQVPAMSVLDWKSERTNVGERLTEIQFAFTRNKEQFIRTLRPGYWSEARAKDKTVVEEGEVLIAGKLATSIPWRTVSFEPDGFMEATPPLIDLAWLNLAHWQSAADHRNYLRFIRIGVLTAFGFNEEDVEKIVISPNALISSANENAKIGYVEHGGSAYEAGVKDLERLEAHMEALGVQPLIERTARSTATGRSLDENSRQSSAQRWVRTLEHGLNEGFALAYAFKGLDPDPELAVNIFSDFEVGGSQSDAALLREMHRDMQISHATLIQELKRRGLLNEGVESAKELEAIAQEILNVSEHSGARSSDLPSGDVSTSDSA